MKRLEDYSEDIYKCTKCGLCQSVCPVYEVTGLETAVSRGKFTLLNGIIRGKLKFNRNTTKYLDLCLGCKACNEFCPSGISAEEIISKAKFENCAINGLSFLKRLIVNSFNSTLSLKTLKLLLAIYRTFHLDKVRYPNSFNPGKLLNMFNLQVRETIKYKKMIPVKPLSDLKTVYFPGCINEYINPGTKNAVLMVLEKNGISVNVPKGLSCCGMPARSAGDLKTFKDQAKNNLDKIPDGIDYLITDCASCGSIWEEYAEILDGEYREKAKIIAGKAINITKFLLMIDLYIPETSNDVIKATYHDPCHLNRFQRVHDEPREILKRLAGIEFVEMNEADKCCGASGSFCVINSDISKKISRKKAQNILNSEADMVVTSCPSCKIGLIQGLLELNKVKPVYQLVELLAKYYSK